MGKKPLSRGRGLKIRQDEIDRMVSLYLEGKSFEAIGKETGRHWQTAQKYTLQALKERPNQELRREALKEALSAHFQDLIKALASLIQLLQLPDEDNWNIREWQPPVPDRRNRLLLEALKVSHAQESPLWDLCDIWNDERIRYQKSLDNLRGKVDNELQALENKLAGSGIKVADRFTEILVKRGISLAKGHPIYNPSMLNVKLNVTEESGDAQETLLLGANTQLASAKDMGDVLPKASTIMTEMQHWIEVKSLHTNFEKMVEIQDGIEEEVEVLSLKRAFPGRCRVCPV